jgi:myo-inositol-1(or 4)-monophosphatase
VPHCCTVIALAQDKEVVLGVTYDPFRDEAFCAEKGKGATLNGKRVAVSDKQELRDCLIGCDLGYVDIKGTHALDLLHRLWPGMQGLRIMGSSSLSLAYASCGRLDLYFHHHLYPWDIAAGLLLVTEAGGVVLDKHGGQSDLSKESVIASSETLVRKFLEATEGFEWRG